MGGVGWGLAAGGTLLIVACSVCDAAAPPAKDLSSPIQAKRDSAATSLRASYGPTPRSKWEPMVRKLVPGMTKAQMMAKFAPRKLVPEGSFAGGGDETARYRIDDDWIIVCAFVDRSIRPDMANGRLVGEPELVASTKHYWVKPPVGFSGTWTVYFANGQKSDEIQYRNGSYFGTFTSFRDDGSKAVVQHYDAKGANGEDTGYHRNGMIAYRGQYKDGKRAGTWTWYDETGKVTSSQEALDR